MCLTARRGGAALAVDIYTLLDDGGDRRGKGQLRARDIALAALRQGAVEGELRGEC